MYLALASSSKPILVDTRVYSSPGSLYYKVLNKYIKEMRPDGECTKESPLNDGKHTGESITDI